MSESDTKPSRVIVKKWEPHSGPMTVTSAYYIPDPARMARIAAAKLQLELLGKGCGCHTPAELMALLKDLGCDVEIEGAANAETN